MSAAARPTPMPAIAPATSDPALVVVHSGDGAYGIPVGDVREVLPMVALSAAAGTPGWVMGVLNLRGRPVAVIDLRVRLGGGRTECRLETPIVVVERGGLVAGVVADSVSDLRTLRREDVHELPDGGVVRALGALEGAFVGILDVAVLFAGLDATG